MKYQSGLVELTINVNGEERSATVRSGDTLARTLRETLGLTGTKIGCENGDCGSCTVIIDKRPAKSCLIPTLSVADREITTIEGLHDTPLQRAFIEEYGFQCGFCTPGQIMNATELLERSPKPTDEEIREQMESNLCRCTGYEGIERAVKRAAGIELPPQRGSHR